MRTLRPGYCLSSLPAEVARFAAAVRGHWGIENSVHWVLDVRFNEDRCRVRQLPAAQNLATLRVVCLNLLRRDQQHQVGLRAKQKAAGWSHDNRLSLRKFEMRLPWGCHACEFTKPRAMNSRP